MTEEQIKRIKENPELVVRYMASKRFATFARYMMPTLEMTNFHKVYYEVLNKFAHGEIRKLIISVAPQEGKALQVDTPVLTTKGWKRHGDLAVGDYVFGEDGKPKMVQWVSGNYLWHTMNVDFADGFSLIAAHEHEWELWCDRDRHKGGRGHSRILREKERLETQDIFSRRHRRNPYIMANAVIDMPERQLPIDPYLLGYWLGDGYAEKGYICSGEEDAWNLEQFGKVKKRKNGDNHNYYICHIEGLSKALRLNGLIKNKHIPIEYILSSKEQRMELLRGLMDTDGCVNMVGGCEFTQKECQLVEDIYVLLRSLGYKPTRHTYKAMLNGRCVGNKVRIKFVPNKGDRIFKLPRKQSRIDNKTRLDREDKYKFFVTGTSENNLEQVNCIQVEGGMYLAGYELVPTHNSTGSSRLLPAFLLGLNPDLKIAIGSYNADQAKSFNYDVQKIINSEQYKAVFPNSFLNTARVRLDNIYKCNAEVSEMVGHSGSLRAVGRNGSLTGKSVDIMILDDVYKDYNEANSSLIREQAWKWYSTVCRTRLHNDSQEIIVFTRWHEDDIIGKLEKSGERIIPAEKWSDFDNVHKSSWVHLNFPALKVGKPTELDPRKEGEALWESKHSRAKLLEARSLDPVQFECLYQGNPSSAESRMYGEFKTYVDKSEYGTFLRRGCLIDTADKGEDYLTALFYDIYKSPNTLYNEKTHKFEPILFALITDLIYTQDSTEITTSSVPMRINLNGCQKIWVESNNGGSQFATAIEKKIKAPVSQFYTRENKETKILSSVSGVMQSIVFPLDWLSRWETFGSHLTRFLRNVKGNAHDDCADAVSMLWMKEIQDNNAKPYNKQRRGISRKN